MQQLCQILPIQWEQKSLALGQIIHIDGVKNLKGCTHKILPDMIEIGSFIGLAAITKSEITIKNVEYEKLGVIPSVFSKLGIKIERKGDDNVIFHHKITTKLNHLLMANTFGRGYP